MAAESNLKRECRELSDYYGGRLVNVSALSWNGFPDSILLIPGCQPVFVEFKAPGKRPRRNQVRWGVWLKEAGFNHWLIARPDVFEWQLKKLIMC